MEKMADLRDLLKHEVQDLISAEDQIIEAMPAMIEKAGNSELKQALREHLRVTEQQRKRLDQVQKALGESGDSGSSGLFSRLFGSGGHKCKGMEGIISEGEKIMGEEMNPEVLDAAIIASAQKIEHYEITSYGTAKAFARELKLQQVERLLDQTLSEEYKSDELLTRMAVGKVNVKAEKAGGNVEGSARAGGRSGSSSRSAGSSKAASKSSPKKASGGRRSAASKSSSRGGRTTTSKSSSGSRRSSAGTKSRSSSASARGSKAAGKSSAAASRSGSPSRGATKSSRSAGRVGSKTASKSGSRSKSARGKR